MRRDMGMLSVQSSSQRGSKALTGVDDMMRRDMGMLSVERSS